MDGFHIEGMPEDKRQPLAGAQVSEPLPGEEAFDADDQIRPIGRNRLEKGLWPRWHITMDHDLSILVEDAQGHSAGMQVNATVKLMLFRVEAHGELLCRRPGHRHRAIGKLLEALVMKKELAPDHSNADPHGR
jgi:hypothetical protein